jgi:lipoyl(octanoyl) transferase
MLAQWGIAAGRIEGLTGVWVDGAKVAAIGVGVHRWVTFHGAAINVTADLDNFSNIIPCGIADKPVTSLEKLLASPPALDEVASAFEEAFRGAFEVSA